MIRLSIDVETYSSIDIKKSGVYPYAAHPDFAILLFGYAIDDGPAQVVDLAQGEVIPADIVHAIVSGEAVISAFNAQFERACLSRHFGVRLPPEMFRCTMVHSLSLGLPGNLAAASKVLFPNEEEQKMTEGKALIQYFCKPCKPTKANKGRLRNLPADAPEKWNQFVAYNKRDVEVEQQLGKIQGKVPMPQGEWDLYHLDQRINDRGVQLDLVLIEKAIECAGISSERYLEKAVALTGLENPNSVAQLKAWLEGEGMTVKSLSKENVKELTDATDEGRIKQVLELRQELAKSSIKKYHSMQEVVGDDGRVRGLLQFYGAHTGRWSGRLCQPQNYPRITLEEAELDAAREMVKAGQYDALGLLWDSPQTVLSNLLRTAFVAKPGHRIINCDLASIEARVLAWVAGEEWALEEFRGDGKIYEATAARMYGVPKAEIKKGDPRRQRGKQTVLSCGYQGGVNALVKVDKEKAIPVEEMPEMVAQWRKANPNICRLWHAMNRAAIDAVKEKKRVQVGRGIAFGLDNGFLFMKLPSGRCLYYARPQIKPHPKWEGEALTYEGVNSLTKKWERMTTYGGSLVENCVQAIARDIIAEGMCGAEKAGYPGILTVHDEILAEVPEGFGGVAEMIRIMTRQPAWAPDLPLGAEGAESFYYHK